ncbi:MAG: hypothetical protein HQ541_23665, partial [Mariniphaga sp.]|nr:hypothetical protein [Mariniphaga sp.]
MDVILLDTINDLTDSRIEKIADRFKLCGNITFKPLLIVGTKSLNHNSIGFDLPDRRKLYLDSSIWIRYIHNIEKESIKTAFKEIENHAELYKTKIAKEFIEFQSRIVKESKLKVSGGHASDVTPFVFHSETKMRYEANKIIDQISKYKLSWNCLLVDDYAESTLSGAKEEGLTKINVINKVLNEVSNTDNTISPAITIDPVYKNSDGDDNSKDIIWKALCKLAESSYDIILLDYLLGDSSTSHREREYSHELLKIITGIFNEEACYGGGENYSGIIRYKPTNVKPHLNKSPAQIVKGIKLNRSPLNKYWILNISS